MSKRPESRASGSAGGDGGKGGSGRPRDTRVQRMDRDSKIPRPAGGTGKPARKGGKSAKSGPPKPHFAKPRPKKAPEHPPAPPRLRYILFHKPYGVLCQFTPEGGKTCLKDFVDVSGVYPCGRLDWDSEGLVLLTNDGPLIERLLTPRFKLAKTYWSQVEGIPDEAALADLRNGVEIEGKATMPARVERFPKGNSLPERSVPIRFRKSVPTSWLSLWLVEGRNRQVRKMTAAVGHPTLRLIRYSIGPFNLDGLAPGKWRELPESEVRRKLSTFSARP